MKFTATFVAIFVLAASALAAPLSSRDNAPAASGAVNGTTTAGPAFDLKSLTQDEIDKLNSLPFSDQQEIAQALQAAYNEAASQVQGQAGTPITSTTSVPPAPTKRSEDIDPEAEFDDDIEGELNNLEVINTSTQGAVLKRHILVESSTPSKRQIGSILAGLNIASLAAPFAEKLVPDLAKVDSVPVVGSIFKLLGFRRARRDMASIADNRGPAVKHFHALLHKHLRPHPARSVQDLD